jgi:hypothetical protein
MPFANDAFLDGSAAAAAQGMWPRSYDLAPWTVLYRFISLTHAPSPRVAADGPWWFEFEGYQQIRAFAERNRYPLGYAARLFAGILYEWNEVDAVVRAEVIRGPLRVWKGRGKQVAARRADARDVAVSHGLITERRALAEREPPASVRMTPMQGPLEVLQIYIPGLGRPHRRFNDLMRLVDVQGIATG